MNDFEFLSNFAIGQYLPVNSPIHRRDARIKILALLVFLIAITFAPSIPGLLLGIGAILIAFILARIPLRYPLRAWITLAPFLLILTLIQLFMTPSQGSPTVMHVGPLSASLAGVWSGLRLISRFTGYILLINLISAVLSTSEMTHGLEAMLHPFERLGLPSHDLVLVVQVTLRFLPILMLNAERIAKAQASRGAEWGLGSRNPFRRAQQIVPLIVPLFLAALRRAENLALAMDARGYASHKRRTSMVQMRFRSSDEAFLAAVVLSAAAMFII